MSLATAHVSASRPQLRLVQGRFRELVPGADWRRVAAAVLACTHELSHHLIEQRWVRVDEALRERRELLDEMARMPLDGEGRRCLRSLQEAAEESERAVRGMLNPVRATR